MKRFNQKKLDDESVAFTRGEVQRSALVVVLHIGKNSFPQHLVQPHSVASRCKAQEVSEGHIKKDCPKYKVQDQSSDTAAIAAMAVDESDILLAASEDGKSDWVLDSDSAYHLYRDREVFSTYVACEGRIWMANNTSSRVVGRVSVRFCMADRRSVTLTKGELLSDMGPVVLARRMDKGSNRCTEVRRASAGVPRGSGVDVYRKAQRKETKSILTSCTTKGAATPKRVSFALDLISGGDLSSYAHKGGEIEPRQLAK
ncbi:hypothetical protein Acr_05g0003910 [Actinidia rufa]|uniref:Retrovirus-related Pol polyprotein from transposon TNT 1-94-like beta-barrel domain-containing protein n=1 Tax=Actinidia rufa TaxID=165716 RepID=A0A7J0EKD4_9ERIC|nr:hypothetical protein Acr_05g0003910 [Actinidia rufa]